MSEPGKTPIRSLLSELDAFQSGERRLPLVMGVLNLTPDSFSDGGQFTDQEEALHRTHAMLDAGADIIDIGGESTRPGAEPVSAEDEIDRVIPVLRSLADNFDCLVSIDTSKPEVMQAAVDNGAALLNDVNALRTSGAMELAAAVGLPVCLMHMAGEPRSMQQNPVYTDVVQEVKAFLQARIHRCEGAGIPKARLIIDPGFGFGKTLEHNLELLRSLEQLKELGCPILAGLSRKAMLGQITGRPVDQRLAASITAAVLAYQNGASILRVHDVAATVDALKVAAELR